MHGLTRYILRQSLGAALFVTVALSAAIWLTQSLRLVDLIVNRGLSVLTFDKYTLDLADVHDVAGALLRVNGTRSPC
jgi:lipopolysaccharide export system permease protein